MNPTVHTYDNSFRTAKAKIAAEYHGVELDVPAGFKLGESNKSPEFLARHPLGTVPAMDHGDVALTDSNAIAHYVANLKEAADAAYSIVGHSLAESSAIMQWFVFAAGAVEAPAMKWMFPIWGYAPYNKPVVQAAQDDIKRALARLNDALLTRTFLVGERVTLADIAVASSLYPLFKNVLSPEWRAPYKNVVRWYVTCMNQAPFKKVFGECELAAVEAKPAVPKKEAKPAAPKEAAAPKKAAAKPAADDDADEDDVPREPKAKSALDSLPPSPFNLEDWKRFYSNNDTKPTAMDYFWKHFDAEGYSIWRVDYKYNDELKKTFMSANLIGGFFNRLERARKYAFGSLCVLGADNANSIAGYFVIRGQEVPFEVYDAADYDSYTFVKVDPTDEAARALIADYFAWEDTIEGQKCADGKVFK